MQSARFSPAPAASSNPQPDPERPSSRAGATKLANLFGKRVLFLTHQKDLLHQTQKSFFKSGIDTGICGDSVRDLAHPTIIATVQTLYAGFEKRDKKGNIKKKADPEIMALLKSIDFIFIDEAHRGDARSFQAVCTACTNAYYRIGLTATPLMKGLFEDIALISQTAGVIYRITIADLVARGLLAQPYIQFVKITTPLLNQKLAYASAYKQGIQENDFRNQDIVNKGVEFARAGLTTLILVTKIPHGKDLLARFSKYPGLRVQFVHGSKDTDTPGRGIRRLSQQTARHSSFHPRSPTRAWISRPYQR